jgi:hypothetical protein
MTPTPTPPELQALMDAEIALEGHCVPADEKRILSLIEAMPGVEEPTFYGGLLVLRFDPMSVSQSHIRDALVEAGFKMSWMKVAAASPITDAVHH